jgi:predicted GNAT superfamily acetyltransferase
MMKLKLRYLGILTLAVGGLVLGTVASTTPASSQSGGYFGQRATQDRDYSRMQAQTQRLGKTEKVTMGKKKKKGKKAAKKSKKKKVKKKVS